MKRVSFFIACMFLASCFKYIKVDNSLQYTIMGIQDITIDQNDSASLNVGIYLNSGDPANEYITATVTGLPAGVTLNQDSFVFRPSFHFILTFHGYNPQPGVYPLQVTMNSPSRGTTVHPFNLTVTSLYDCTPQITTNLPFLDTTQQSADTLNTGSPNFFANIVRLGCDTVSINLEYDSLLLEGAPPQPFVVQAFSVTVNCTDNTLLVYPQKAGWLSNYTNQLVRGTGKFTPVSAGHSQIIIQDTVYSGSQVLNVNTIYIY